MAVHQRAGTSFDFGTDPNIDVFAMHLSTKGLTPTPDWVQDNVVKAYNEAAGSYAILLSEVVPYHRDLVTNGNRRELRQMLWAAIMGGVAGVQVIGPWAPTPPTNDMLRDMKRVQSFFEATNFQTMTTNADGNASGQTDYARQNSAGDYILYSDACTPGSSLGYTNILAAGSYTLYWFDAVDGSTFTHSKTLTVGAETFAVPSSNGIGSECALWIHN